MNNVSGTFPKRTKNHLFMRIISLLLIFTLLITTTPPSFSGSVSVSAAVETSPAINDPVIVQDSSMQYSGQKVIWDCVWFGSYPQTEIVDQPESCGVYGKGWSDPSYYEVNKALYEELQMANYDSNGDTYIAGMKYRRMKISDASYAVTDETNPHYPCMYYWSDETTYHYFRYEPIKWRVLDVDGDDAFLVADYALDAQPFNLERTSVSWETSTIRSWLNGYGSSANACGQYYCDVNFMSTAFTGEQADAIKVTDVVNNASINYRIDCGNDTEDPIFLLSDAETKFTDAAASYGFLKTYYISDEARRCKSSTYAEAMGVWTDSSDYIKGDCYWLLRTSGSSSTEWVETIQDTGMHNSSHVDAALNGCRPALHLDLTCTDQYCYAGTVCSDKTMAITDHAWDEGTMTQPTYTANGLKICTCTNCGFTKSEIIPRLEKTAIQITASDITKTYSTKARTYSIGAESNGEAALTYTSDSQGITVDSDTGLVTINAKYIGQATITISSAETETEKSAVKEITVKVNPSKTTLSSASNLKGRKIQVKWKKNSCGTGYKVQYSRSSKFSSGNKTVTIKKNSTLSTKISGLSKGKTYYVRIRTYKVVSGKNFYSDWSTAKKVKVTK